MARIQLKDLSIDQVLDAQALETIRGGLNFAMPTDQFSLNFAKMQQKVAPGGDSTNKVLIGLLLPAV